MHRVFCDWCKVEVEDGPLGGYSVLEMQPSYTPVLWKDEICPTCVREIEATRIKLQEMGDAKSGRMSRVRNIT